MNRAYPEQWEVVDHDNDNRRPADSRTVAEDMAATACELGSDDVEILSPQETTTDGGSNDVEIINHVDPNPEPGDADEAADLPERSVADDPLTWMPGHFVDDIDGTPAVNRKGFEVLSHFYDVSVTAELQAPPEETDHEYARVKATATTDDGRTCEAFGSAHIDRGDNPELLLEMAGTRARKRALSIATGTGAVAVEELRSEVE
jgi:hypothetical protein